MNYLFIGGADCKLKVDVIHQYAKKLQGSADFDLVRNQVPEGVEERFWCIFTNRITGKSVFVNSEKLSPELFEQLLRFKSGFPPGDAIVTLIPSPDAPDRHALMEKFNLSPDDYGVEISLDNLDQPHADLSQAASDKIEDILTQKPFNLL